MSADLNVVLVASQHAEAELLLGQLRQDGFAPVCTHADDEASLQIALRTPPELILSCDGSSASLSWQRVLELTRTSAPDVPCILICDVTEETAAIAALEQGATDYILSDRTRRLGPAVRRALRERIVRQEKGRIEQALHRSEAQHQVMLKHSQQSEEQYRSVVEGAMEGLAIHQDGIIRFANRSAARLAGYERAEDIIGRNIWETFVAPEARSELQARAAAALQGRAQPLHAGWPGIRRDGSRVWVQSSIALIQWQGRPAFLGYFWDNTEHKQAEERLRASEERFYKAFHGSPLPVSIVTRNDGRYIDVNASLTVMLGRARDDIIGKTALELNLWVDPDDRRLLVAAVMEHSVAKSFETQLRVANEEIRDVLIFAEAILLGADECMIVVTQDITERKRAEAEQRELEEQLRHAQKMEAVGQLAGGMAHDFNNLLTIIQGHAALLLTDKDSPGFIDEAAEQISLAAERAATLTRQLLAFSRRQRMDPRVLDINEVIDRTGKMLRRTLGEDIELVVHHAPALPMVHADPGMIEQVLLNLAVNARDAMPEGGKLVISTSSALIMSSMVQQMPDAAPGPAVCIMVTDTGCGIAPEDLPRIFEPFFTTKEVGKGTGLGLATAYGIMSQHRGGIRVTSQLAKGTTFQLFLPASHARAEAPAPAINAPACGGNEGILLVEDEHNLRVLVRGVLERYGYRVFEASSAKTALQVWSHRRAEIQLLLTDMVMPDGLTGRQLAAELRVQEPELKVIYSSGYSADVVGKGLALEEGLNFLQKPYDPRALAKSVRACLDSRQI
jgi:two-component system, cell cycle sensor histidine kinase and response regulator CckA